MENLKFKRNNIVKGLELVKTIKTALGSIELFTPTKINDVSLNNTNVFGGNSIVK